MEQPLSGGQLADFRRDGFVRLDEAFPPLLARRCRDLLWEQVAEKRDDRTTWRRAVVRIFSHAAAEFTAAARCPRWVEGILQVAGPDAAPTPWMGGTTAVRFPVEGDPGDDGWHIDGSYEGPDGGYWVNRRSRGRALLMLVLFSDVGHDDGPTRLLAGSQLDVPAALGAFGEEGVPSLRFVPPACVHDRPLALATGRAGDVYLCHPFLVHAGQRNRGTEPRFVAQPGVPWKDDACGLDQRPDPGLG